MHCDATIAHVFSNDLVQDGLAVAVLASKSVPCIIAARFDAADGPGHPRDDRFLQEQKLLQGLLTGFTLHWKQRHGTTRSQHMYDPSASKIAKQDVTLNNHDQHCPGSTVVQL
jgi:hypothetical protein